MIWCNKPGSISNTADTPHRNWKEKHNNKKKLPTVSSNTSRWMGSMKCYDQWPKKDNRQHPHQQCTSLLFCHHPLFHQLIPTTLLHPLMTPCPLQHLWHHHRHHRKEQDNSSSSSSKSPTPSPSSSRKRARSPLPQWWWGLWGIWSIQTRPPPS